MDLSQDRFLDGRLQLWQPRNGYRAGTDPVLLAACVPARPGEVFLDLGCGVGTAGLCLAWRSGAAGFGLELQPDYAALARRNATEAGLPLQIVEGDVHDMPAELRARVFDHVLLNPPYFAQHAGTPARDAGRDTAMRDRSDLAQWLGAASRRLRPRGTLSVIVRADRLQDLLSALPAVVGSLRVLPLAPRAGRPAKRVLLQGTKEGAAPLTLLAPLILHSGDHHEADGDDFTALAAGVLRRGAEINL